MLGRYLIADGEALALPLTAGVWRAEKRHHAPPARAADGAEYDRGYQAAFSKGYLRGHSLGVNDGMSERFADGQGRRGPFVPRPHPGLSRKTTAEFGLGYVAGFGDGLKTGYEEGLRVAVNHEVPGLRL
jgi:hypothetical protein